ncbi:MAG: glycosyltransferase family 4 protein [Nitrospiraceae bacterium]|nr:MAG: glycosyltransferase family 4 protein [Nitrospiraceae bacterium]
MAHKLYIAPQRKLTTIVNGINPDPFITASRNGAGKNIRTRLGIDEKHCVIGSTGRLVPVKDIGTLIRSLKFLKFLVPDIPVTLLLAGAGTDQDRLENLVSSLGLAKEVRFLGFVKDISEFLAGIDIFVTTSLSEGLSISLLEAMAAARPIVASSILPNTELIEHAVTGLIVPVKSPDNTARAIARLIQEPDLAQQCAKQARERILKDYTIDRMFQETWNLYNDLLNEGKAVKLESKQNA